MTPKEKAEEVRNSFIDVTKNFHPEQGWVKDLDSAKHAGIIALNLMRTTRRRGEDYDYTFWDDVQKELESF